MLSEFVLNLKISSSSFHKCLYIFKSKFIKHLLKVARVIKLNLAFMEWFFYNLVILIKLYKIPYLNLDKTLLFPRNQAICLITRKRWRAPTATNFNIFWWNFAHVSFLVMPTKGCSGFFFFFLILFRSWVVNKNAKSECVESRSFFIFANTSRSKQNDKNPKHTFVDIGK